MARAEATANAHKTELHFEKVEVGTLRLAVGVGAGVCGWQDCRVRDWFSAPHPSSAVNNGFLDPLLFRDPGFLDPPCTFLLSTC